MRWYELRLQWVRSEAGASHSCFEIRCRLTHSSAFSPLSPESKCATLWFARNMLPSAAQHFRDSDEGTIKKAVMMVRGEREHSLYNGFARHQATSLHGWRVPPTEEEQTPRAKITPP